MANRRKHLGVPADIRAAVNVYTSLRRVGKAVSENIMILYRAYQRMIKRLKDPGIGRRRRGRQPEHDVPEELRAANREYQRLRHASKPIPDDLREAVRSYDRMIREKRKRDSGDDQAPAGPKPG